MQLSVVPNPSSRPVLWPTFRKHDKAIKYLPNRFGQKFGENKADDRAISSESITINDIKSKVNFSGSAFTYYPIT